MDKISIVIPCLNEEEALPLYYQAMSAVMEQMTEAEFELIFVDDGSTDGTAEVMRQFSQTDPRCRYLIFSRNFGKEAAIYAGLLKAEGDYAAVMDADLQDPPRLLPKMYRILKEEPYDSVAARRSTRDGEAGFRSVLAETFYRIVNRVSDTQMESGARDYRLMSRQMLDAVLSMTEYSRFSKGLFAWVGFRTKWLEYPNEARCAGETKWPFGKLVLYALEGICSFSVAPLYLALGGGCGLIGLSVIGLLAGLLPVLLTGAALSGLYLVGCLLVFLSGIILTATGISAWYLSRTYLEVKHRPAFLLREESSADMRSAGKKAVPFVYAVNQEREKTEERQETMPGRSERNAASYSSKKHPA